ncbi:MAG: ribosome silencing factor [Acidobacteria bacterium]|nr:ribosome silencing factor [Acidobacteriota bacterium]MCA1638624.1 ribosome silencing factor [Acidobacteriota bacterium]
MEAIQEKSLQHETKTADFIQAVTPFEEVDEVVKLAVHFASEKKAFNIVALDLREIASFAEFFVIASGANQRQVQAISDEISEQLKAQLNARPIRIEGYRGAEWILLDYGDFIVHIFEEKSREFYDLERLWRDAKKVQIPENI